MRLSKLFGPRKKKEAKNANCDLIKSAEPVKKFRVRVEGFDRENEFYCTKYSFDGGLTWKVLSEFRDYGIRGLAMRDPYEPVLHRNFDHAVEIAKTLTEELLREHEAANERERLETIARADALREKRNRFFTT